MSFCVTVHFAANGETTEVDEYTERSFNSEAEAQGYFDSALADYENARYGVSGIRLEEFPDSGGYFELRAAGTYAA